MRARESEVQKRRILLLGGGHAHVEVLRRFRESPVPGARIALVSPGKHTAYSGMLPGWVAGHYRREECHIGLAELCGPDTEFHQSAARHIDPAAMRVFCEDGSEHAYDILSVDVGSVSALGSIEGATAIGIRTKPVDAFLQQVGALARRSPGEQRFVIVGGGAAGVELSLALRHRLGAERADFHLVTSSNELLDGHGVLAKKLMHRALGPVTVHLNKHVIRASEDRLHFRDGTTLPFGTIVWATGAAAPSWLAATGLALDERGFILVSENLRSLSHDNVFAAGDVASMRSRDYPKSGAYAVRQGPPLAENLRRALQGQPLLRYEPQRWALALIGTGPRHAVASWGPAAWSGDWVWRWKDAIDRRFMERYRLA
ncbi:MAG: hypothetical protein EXR36_09560 [Betaproteobacteria bacterium]|nr:hypothetical protein [Betaproteobacteria bacterium]